MHPCSSACSALLLSSMYMYAPVSFLKLVASPMCMLRFPSAFSLGTTGPRGTGLMVPGKTDFLKKCGSKSVGECRQFRVQAIALSCFIDCYASRPPPPGGAPSGAQRMRLARRLSYASDMKRRCDLILKAKPVGGPIKE